MEENKRNDLIFVAGIHGVGKSTFCSELARELGGKSISASSLIRKGTELKKNKEVKDVKNNQEILLNELKKERSKHDLLFLDGHFCLIDKNQNTTKIPIKTFNDIAPSKIILLYEDIETIHGRLEKRDSISHERAKLNTLQDEEISWGKSVSRELSIPLILIKPKFNRSVEEFIKGREQ